MQEINVKGVGILTEQQIRNLITNARKYRAENQVLKEEIQTLKEVA